jgi:Protein of unknown function (DUF3093)
VAGYDERLRVPWWWWVVGAGLISSVVVVYVVYTPLWLAAGVAAVLISLFVLGLWRYGRARVRVDQTGLRAGRATLLPASMGDVRVVDAQVRRKLLGPEADARAYVFLRGYVPGGVYVQVIDEAAEQPYWFVSSRQPEALADALTRVSTRR